MRARGLVPVRLQSAAQTGYVAVGRLTADLRRRPSFVMVGASRAGTTSLFRALVAHPQVHRPTVNKGIRYFDLNYERPPAWYYGHFPLAWAHQASGTNRAPVTFEASGYYMFHPFAIERIARHLPTLRIVAMLRDPVERAFSAWKHETARGFEWESFERALVLEDERLRGEVERMRLDVTYRSFSHLHHSYRHRGEYAEQIERIYRNFPCEQVHIIQSENFFAEPAREYARLIEFLQLQPFAPRQFDKHNARPSSPMPEVVRRELEEHYRLHDERLVGLLGHGLAWGR